jgi:heme exporter protein C
MIFILLISFIYSIRYLSSGKEEHDIVAIEAVKVGLLFGVLGFITGSFWGNYSWGELSAWLTSEPRSLASMIAMLFYVAYIILRGSLEEVTKRAKISAVYNVFAFVLYLLFIIVVPRLTESLHPGAGGNPGFNIYDSDNNLKVVLYPAWLAYMLLALWITNILVRAKKIELKTLTNDI